MATTWCLSCRGRVPFVVGLLAFACAKRDRDTAHGDLFEAEQIEQVMADAPPGTVDHQIARGAHVFDRHCERCHGNRGQGSKEAPALLGNALVTRSDDADGGFGDAQALFEFVSREMPHDEPGQLGEGDYWDVIAFLLQGNDVHLTEQVGPENAAAIHVGGGSFEP